MDMSLFELIWEFIFFGGNKLWNMSINRLVKYIRPRKLI